MIKNYLTVAIRNFFRNPFNTSINLLGLTTGITFCLLLLFIIQDELQIDRFHEGGDRIYRAYFNGLDDNGQITFTQGASPYVLYTTLQEFDQVEKAIYFDGAGEFLLEYNKNALKETAYWGSISIFEAFSFPLLEGGVSQAEQHPMSIFISETLAEKLLGSAWKGNTVGIQVKVNEQYNLTIAGVFKDIGPESSIRFDLLINVQALVGLNGPDSDWATHWGSKGATVMAKLVEGADYHALEDQVNAIYKDKPGTNAGGEHFTLFPFEDNYLWTEFEKGIRSGGPIEYVRIFFGSALFLLLIACINYINVATAQASKRAKEVGVRKTVGAGEANLVIQFLVESGLLIFSSLALSFGFLYYLLPMVNKLTEKELVVPIDQPVFWLAIIGIWGILTLLAGLYPSFVLSKFKPVKALKDDLSSRFAHKNIRKALVVLQFVLSAILIIAAMVMHQQISFIQTQNLGLNRNNILHFQLPGLYRDKYALLKEQLQRQAPGTEVVSASQVPTNLGWINVNFNWEGRDPENGGYFYLLYTDFGFDDLTGIEMKEGRFFDKNKISDTLGVVINEKALDFVQMENPVGKIITGSDGTPLTILGIVKNFNFRSLHTEIEPLMMRVNPNFGNTIMVKPVPEATAQTIALLKNIWKEIIPSYPLEYEFLDESYSEMYRSEEIIGRISWYLAVIAIFISCLGLFGLITFLASQKTKEIGIRKVLGATTISIVAFLSKDFVKLIFLGVGIAAPLSWYGMNQWLQNYAYHIKIQWWTFVLAGVVLLLIGLITISFQSIKAALANPVKSLRSE